jgi:hypothetical protein
MVGELELYVVVNQDKPAISVVEMAILEKILFA